jgi:hypothetical protein
VNQEDEEEEKLDDDEKRIRFEDERVPVEGVGSEEDHQVAGDVDQKITKECEAGDSDEQLRADRGRKDTQS